jgi:hypothetical protein
LEGQLYRINCKNVKKAERFPCPREMSTNPRMIIRSLMLSLFLSLLLLSVCRAENVVVIPVNAATGHRLPVKHITVERAHGQTSTYSRDGDYIKVPLKRMKKAARLYFELEDGDLVSYSMLSYKGPLVKGHDVILQVRLEAKRRRHCILY